MQLSWTGNYDTLQIYYNHEFHDTINGLRNLPQGKTITMPNGDHVLFWLQNGHLRILRNGEAIDGYNPGAIRMVQGASLVMLFFAVLSIGIGYAALSGQSEELQNAGIGWYTTLMGIGLLLAGIFAFRREPLAFLAGILIYGFDLFLVLLFSLSAATFDPSVLVIRIIVLAVMVLGMRAASELSG